MSRRTASGTGTRVVRRTRSGRRRPVRHHKRIHSRPRRYYTTYYRNLPWYDFWRPSYWSYYPYYLYYGYYGYPYTYPYYGYWDSENNNGQNQKQKLQEKEQEEANTIKQIESNMKTHENFQLTYLLLLSAGLIYLLKKNN